MAHIQPWSMDRLAAANLLADLGVEPTPEHLEKATRHFAQHRHHASGWAAERLHAGIVDQLERAARSDHASASFERSEGFRFAEEQVLTVRPEDLLQLAPDHARTKGQILRGLMRRARRKNALSG